jgi:hypothetical protein
MGANFSTVQPLMISALYRINYDTRNSIMKAGPKRGKKERIISFDSCHPLFYETFSHSGSWKK